MIKAILVTWTLAIAAIAILSAGPPAPDPKSTQGALPLPAPPAGATYVGSEACAQCHYDKFVSYMNQPHSHSGDPRTPGSRFGCESCHGPASNHVTGGGGRNVGGLMNFSNAMPTSDRNAVCLQCHTRGSTALWHASTHDERKLACMDCHAVHGGNQKLLQQPTQQQLCTKCHQQIRTALMKTSHHPLREEKMQCTSCHNPHGTQAPRLIAANSINDKCVECHSEKRGPFLFEHPPVRENCLNCHDPHGSSHEPLLVVKKPLLCQRCHASGFHPSILYAQSAADRSAGRTVYQSYAQLPYRSCTNCHVNVHGSNSPSGKFWHR
jgi:DmsE family decaheme c-type cytochrome